MYVECPHCHAIFALPTGPDEIPEHVRCGECNTIFTPQSENQTEDNNLSDSQTHSKEPLSVSDFLTDSASSSPANDDASENNEESMDQDIMESFQNYLDGDSYPEEPEIELPDLNIATSVTPVLEDPLKEYQANLENNETETVEDIPQMNQTVVLPDDESSDLVSDRLVDSTDEDDSLTFNTAEESNQNKSVLPDINEELIATDEKPVENNPETKQQDIINTDIESEDISDLAIDSYLDNRAGEDKHSLTGEFSAFIDEVDDDPQDLFSADRADSVYEQQFLSLDDEPETQPVEPTDEDSTSEQMEDENLVAVVLKQSDESSETGLLDIPPYMPAPILEATEEPSNAAYNKMTWLYTLGGLLLLLTLSVQYIYFHREQFAVYPETRPLITGLCKITGCSVSPLRDLSAIKLLNHGIYSHPSTDKALIIKALIRNQAKFPQAYPTIELTLADLNDHKVALRRFGPGEYLSKQPAEESLMPVGENIPVHLQVIDPGQEAVAFEFEFL